MPQTIKLSMRFSQTVKFHEVNKQNGEWKTFFRKIGIYFFVDKKMIYKLLSKFQIHTYKLPHFTYNNFYKKKAVSSIPLSVFHIQRSPYEQCTPHQHRDSFTHLCCWGNKNNNTQKSALFTGITNKNVMQEVNFGKVC